jgi:hypothetical protein
MTKIIKPIPTTETDRFRGYRAEIPDGCNHGPLKTNARALDSVVHPNTLPMRAEIMPAHEEKPSELPRKARNRTGLYPAPMDYKVVRRRASADEMHNAAKHSPEVESFYSNVTLKHPAFTSRRRRNDQEE